MGVIFPLFLECSRIQTSNDENNVLFSTRSNYTDSLLNTKELLFYNLISNIELFIADHCNDEHTFVVVWCEKEKDNTFINLSNTNYYNSNKTESSIIIKDRIVVFDLSCIASGVIDTLLFNKYTPAIFLYDDDQNDYDIFEPYMYRYLINKNDSMELIFKGYF